MDGLEVSRHEMMRDRAIGGLARGSELHAHFDKERARRHGPEGLGIAAIAGDQRGGGRDVIGVVLAVVEDGPRRAALVHGVEDVIAPFLVEGLDERHP
jgi:hypothetical protein